MTKDHFNYKERQKRLEQLLELLPSKYKKTKYIPNFKKITKFEKDGNFDKIGGIPSIDKKYLNNKKIMEWPKCGLCKNNLKFIFQISILIQKTLETSQPIINNEALQFFMCLKCDKPSQNNVSYSKEEITQIYKKTTLIRKIKYKNCIDFRKIKKHFDKSSNVEKILKYSYDYYDKKELSDARNYDKTELYKSMERNGKYILVNWNKDSKNYQLQCYKIESYSKSLDLDCKYNLFKIIKKFEIARQTKGLVPWLCICDLKEKVLENAENNISVYLKKKEAKEIISKRYNLTKKEKIAPEKLSVNFKGEKKRIKKGSYNCECFEELLHEHILKQEESEFIKIGGIGVTSNGLTHDSLISFIESKYIPYQWGENGGANIYSDYSFDCEN